jgi:membrane protease YdiL (CAAX protease family)
MKELFFNYPLGLVAYLILILAIISIWIHKKPYVFMPLLILSLAFSYYGKIIEPKAFLLFGLLALLYFYSKKNMPLFWKLLTVISLVLITIGSYTNLLKGVNNILVFPDYRLSRDATSVNIYANYDKGVIGLLILGIFCEVIDTKKELLRVIFITLPYLIFTAFTIIYLSTYLGIIKYDPKFPLSSGIWLAIQIFFVVIPEEAFYRGFLQKELFENLKNKKFASIIALLSTSLIFTLIHMFFTLNLSSILIAFVTGILYGGIYQITKRVESSILVHLSVNMIHYFFFTYPRLG